MRFSRVRSWNVAACGGRPASLGALAAAAALVFVAGCGSKDAASSGSGGISAHGGSGMTSGAGGDGARAAGGMTGQTGGGGSSGGAGTGAGADTGAGGSTGGPGSGGISADGGSGAMAGALGTGGSIVVSGGGGNGGVLSCVPGVEQAIITDCGYPSTASALSSTVFNESEVLRAIVPSGSWPNGVVSVYYNDEHALTLGVRSVTVKSAAGTTTTDYPLTALGTVPGSALAPQTGTNVLSGEQSGLDKSLRPMWPSLFITDISTNPMNRSGDWQQGGRPRAPDAVFGTWKGAVRTVDTTVNPPLVTIAPDADPAKNKWNLGSGDPAPAGLASEGFGAEMRWNVALTPGHSYRIQVLVHDGDQNKTGGDSGEACVLFCASSSCSECGTDGTGGSKGSTCPDGLIACGEGGIPPESCPTGTDCANGCCIVPL